MSKCEILAGATDQTIDLFIRDSSSTTGGGLTGLAYNSASLVCYYRKGATGTPTALTLATQTVGGAHSDGGFVAVDGTNCPGQYRLDLSDTIVNTAGRVTLYLKGAANMAPCVVEIEVVAVNKFDSVRMGMTSLPNAAAEASGGLITNGTGTGQASVSGGRVKADAVYWNGAAVASPDTAGYPKVTLKTGTGTGELDATGGVVKSNSVQLGGDAQSLTDLKDFADAGYEPLSHRANANIEAINGNTGGVAGLNDLFVSGYDMGGHKISFVGVVDTVTALGATAKTDVSTEVAAALTAFDAVTNTDLDARTLLAAEYATETLLSHVDGNVDAVQVTLGTPAGASVSADIAAIPTAAENRAEMDSNSTKLAALDSRLTSSRAGYLDNLNTGGVVASQADINALNQSASRRIILTTVGQYERPESGSTAFQIEARTYTADGAAVNADSTPTLTATGITSGSLAANLGSATNPSTGVYRWAYTVETAATIEQIRFDLSAAISSDTQVMSVHSQVVDTVAATFTTGDRTKLEAVYNKLPSKSYITGTANSDGDVQADEATGNFPGSVGSVAGAVASVTAGVTVTTNNDKTGYTASTVTDKTGYALTSAYDPAKTAAQAGDAMTLTSGERSAIGAAVWSILSATVTTANSIGKRLLDFVTTLVYSAPPAAAPTPEENAAAVRTELTTELAHLDEDVSSRAAPGDDMGLADSEDVYPADIGFTIDDTNSRDEYTVVWFRNGAAVTSGITVPTIQAIKRANGTDLIPSSVMTQIGSTGAYKYDATTTERTTAGEAVVVVVSATINGATRTWRKVITRDVEVPA